MSRFVALIVASGLGLQLVGAVRVIMAALLVSSSLVVSNISSRILTVFVSLKMIFIVSLSYLFSCCAASWIVIWRDLCSSRYVILLFLPF